jgi:hypothetical protein
MSDGTRHTSTVPNRETAYTDDRRIDPSHVATPVTPVTKQAEPVNSDAHTFRYIDVHIAEREDDRHGGLRAIEFGLTQVEIQVREAARSEGPTTQSQPAADRHVAEEGARDADRFAPPASRRHTAAAGSPARARASSLPIRAL